MTPRQHALRVAVLSTLLDAVKAEYARAREDAGAVFTAARQDGQTQQKVLLPVLDESGSRLEEIGLISIRGGSASVRLDEPGALSAWCEEHAPHHLERYVVEGASGMADVIGLIAEHFPNLVRERIRESARAALEKQMAETGGYVIDENGEKHKLATVTRNEPAGTFTCRLAAGAREKIMAGWAAGNLREIALGPLALPPGDGPGTPLHYDGLTPAWLAELRTRPQSARDLAVTLGQSTRRSNVAAIRAALEQMERKGLVRRTRGGPGTPWIWEACGND